MSLENRLIKLGVKLIHVGCLATLAFTACGQTADHKENEAYVKTVKSLEQSTVLLNNAKQSIPLVDLEAHKFASVSFHSLRSEAFSKMLNNYALVAHFDVIDYQVQTRTLDDLNDDLKFFNTVIVQLDDEAILKPGTIGFIKDIAKSKQVILAVSGNLGTLKNLEGLNMPVVWTSAKSEVSAQHMAQLLFGGVPATARLSENVSATFKKGSGYSTSVIRLNYTVPEELGLNVTAFKEIDDIAMEAIREKATPSMVVMAIKDGKVIFNKAYGTHTYIDRRPTKLTDIYDLASLTKTSATTMAVMRLYEEGKLKLDTNVGAYIPRARKTDKKDIQVREVMLHQAGFTPFIPFYRALDPKDVSRDSSAVYSTKVADSMYIRKGYYDNVMWPQMLESKGNTRGKYVYSDLSMYFMQEMVERQSGVALEKYVQDEFYQSLGMKRAGFNPRYRFDKDEIIPTEDDQLFRKTLLRGYVHDQGAAMAGGVAGHAGLFASANDLAILYQMLLNGGSYGGKQYFKPETVEMFTVKQSPVSRRGLGFDRWDPDSKEGYPSALASPQTYGHTGYTGIGIWVDPKYNLVYIFLSNRVNPTVTTKLYELNIRSRIQDVIYKAIAK